MLEAVDLGRTLARAEYQRTFPALQDRLRRLQYALLDAEVPTVVLFEGWDAAGKSSVLQRLTEKLDPRAFRAWPGSPPSELEQRYHWLWRYQVRLPEDGHMALFDHSWYGRVLVERVEKLVKKKVWRQAYDQINELEWIDGEVFANIWQDNRIARIDPETGVVKAFIDLTALVPKGENLDPNDDVLNGIAWDAAGKRLFVTGKRWPQLFEIKLR